MEQKRSHRALPIAVIACILGVLLLVLNIAFALIPKNVTLLDASGKKHFSISTESQKFLKSLEQDVTLYVLNVDDSDPGFLALLQRYEQYGSHVTVTPVNAKRTPELLAEHEYADAEMSPYSVLIVGPYRSTVLDYMQLFLYRSAAGYSDMSASEYVYAVQSIAAYANTSQYESLVQQLTTYSLYYSGEKLITGAIEYVSMEQIPHAYLLTGHGEADATEGTLATLFTMVGMTHKPLTLDEDTEIPTDATCLVINAPQSDYSEKEAAIVLDYLKQGGNLLLLTDNGNIAMPNLMSIAAYYGATVQEGVVTLPPEEEETESESEGEEQAQETEETEDTEETEEIDLSLLTPTVNSQHEIFAEGTGYTFALSGMNALSTDSSLRAGLLITPLLQSPEDALAAEKAGAHTLAIAVEEPVGDQITKLVWFTGANNFNSKEAVTQNMYLPLFGMHWAFETYTSQVGDIAPISYNTTFMNVSEMSAAWLSVLFIGVIPAAMVGAGILVFMKRRKI